MDFGSPGLFYCFCSFPFCSGPMLDAERTSMNSILNNMNPGKAVGELGISVPGFWFWYHPYRWWEGTKHYIKKVLCIQIYIRMLSGCFCQTVDSLPLGTQKQLADGNVPKTQQLWLFLHVTRQLARHRLGCAVPQNQSSKEVACVVSEMVSILEMPSHHHKGHCTTSSEPLNLQCDLVFSRHDPICPQIGFEVSEVDSLAKEH